MHHFCFMNNAAVTCSWLSTQGTKNYCFIMHCEHKIAQEKGTHMRVQWKQNKTETG